ncbi:MAG: MerR family transcriptional regulator [Polyangiales bacterium]
MHPSDADETPGPGEYTIDELAARSGVPSRTIRFYQAKGVLPPPRKRGRVAVYDDSHAERLKVVGELQDKGLRLRAIRDIIGREDLDSDAIHKWLGVGERLGALSQDAPALVTEEELKRSLGDPQPGVISRLLARGAVQVQGDGVNRRYLVRSPALLELGRRLHEAGIDMETAISLQEILERRLARAAREVVDFAIKKVGQGFGRTAEPDDVMAAIEALFQGGLVGQGVQLIFTKEIERAVQEALQIGTNLVPRQHGHARSRHGRH